MAAAASWCMSDVTEARSMVGCKPPSGPLNGSMQANRHSTVLLPSYFLLAQPGKVLYQLIMVKRQSLRNHAMHADAHHHKIP